MSRKHPQPGFGRAAPQLREERDLSQEALAVGAGLTASSLGQIERGQSNPTWATLTDIADALEVPIAELARRSENAKL